MKTTKKAYVDFQIRNEKGTPIYWGTAPIESADQQIISAFRACPAASYITSKVVEFEEVVAEEAAASSSFVEATLWSPEGEFVMRAYLPASDADSCIAALLRQCPSAVSVSTREVQ